VVRGMLFLQPSDLFFLVCYLCLKISSKSKKIVQEHIPSSLNIFQFWYCYIPGILELISHLLGLFSLHFFWWEMY